MPGILCFPRLWARIWARLPRKRTVFLVVFFLIVAFVVRFIDVLLFELALPMRRAYHLETAYLRAKQHLDLSDDLYLRGRFEERAKKVFRRFLQIPVSPSFRTSANFTTGVSSSIVTYTRG